MSVPVVAARRSPFCAADGVLAGWHPVDLAAVVMREAIAAADLGDDEVDLVVAGCAEPVGAQGANVAQACVLAAGWRSAIPSLVVDAAAVSGFASLAAAADAVAQGRARTAVVVGVSSASIVRPGASALGRQYGRPWGDSVATRYADAGGLLPPVVAADRVALARGIDRPRQDAWGRASHARRPARVDGLVEASRVQERHAAVVLERGGRRRCVLQPLDLRQRAVRITRPQGRQHRSHRRLRRPGVERDRLAPALPAPLSQRCFFNLCFSFLLE